MLEQERAITTSAGLPDIFPQGTRIQFGATPRTQMSDGSIVIPEKLQPFMQNQKMRLYRSCILLLQLILGGYLGVFFAR